MNRTQRLVLAGAALAALLPAARADVLTFDDLAGSAPTFFTSNYNGFQFGTNVVATSGWFYTRQVAPPYGPHSGTTYIATTPFTGATFEDSQAISNTRSFTFGGAWFVGNDAIRYKLYNGSTLVYTSPTVLNVTSSYAFLASGYTGLVNGVVISGLQGNFALDDFNYSFTPTAVPEPATVVLMASGLAALATAARRRRRRV